MLKAYLTKVVSIFFIVATLFTNTLYADISREYQLKAAYLLNFAKFIYWPVEVFPSSTDEFNICVYGESPFGENLNYLLNKKVQGRSIEINHIGDLSDAEACNILFLSDPEKNDYYSISSDIFRHVLTVSDVKGFSSEGGMIEFIRLNNKIKFEINVTQSTRSGIKYRSQLLEVAERLR